MRHWLKGSMTRVHFIVMYSKKWNLHIDLQQDVDIQGCRNPLTASTEVGWQDTNEDKALGETTGLWEPVFIYPNRKRKKKLDLNVKLLSWKRVLPWCESLLKLRKPKRLLWDLNGKPITLLCLQYKTIFILFVLLHCSKESISVTFLKHLLILVGFNKCLTSHNLSVFHNLTIFKLNI